MAENETTTTEAEYKATRLWNEIKYSANKILEKYNMEQCNGKNIVQFVEIHVPHPMYNTLAIPGFIEKIGKETGFCIYGSALISEVRVHISHYETIDVGGDKG